MKPFSFRRPTDTASAIATVAVQPGAKFLAGGTNLVDLTREEVERPDHLVDITRLPLGAIEPLPDGGIRIGATARNTRVANHRLIRERYPTLARAILNGASAQVRNMATVGGNLLQRTRCPYFYDLPSACNKRDPGSGCDAIGGYNRMHAILGASDTCIAVHPSDMCVALAALDAVVQIQGPTGARSTPLVGFHRLPGDTPHVETELAHGELIVALDLPPALPGRSTYVKVGDRASYAFAVVSLAALLDVRDGQIHAARLALGGVAHKPWRVWAVEDLLVGAAPVASLFRRAAELAVEGARTLQHNAFKVELAKRLIARTLSQLAREADVVT